MISGVHAIVYSRRAEQVRAFFRDVLGFASVDAGEGWLIFAAPPTELAVHPAEADESHELFLMCDDVHETVRQLAARGVACRPIAEREWGLVTAIALPGGGDLGLYQPKHPSPLTPRK